MRSLSASSISYTESLLIEDLFDFSSFSIAFINETSSFFCFFSPSMVTSTLQTGHAFYFSIQEEMQFWWK